MTNTLLWILQGLAAAMYLASGIMKVFMFDKVSAGVASFGALPPRVWRSLGILELVCVVGLIVPGVLHWHPMLVPVAAAALALESLVFIYVHAKYREPKTIAFMVLLGAAMALIAIGRMH